jgi:hypothetical protein
LNMFVSIRSFTMIFILEYSLYFFYLPSLLFGILIELFLKRLSLLVFIFLNLGPSLTSAVFERFFQLRMLLGFLLL